MPPLLSGSAISGLLTTRVPEFASGAIAIDSCTLRWTRKKMRKRISEYELRCCGAAPEPTSLFIIAKQYAEDRGGHAYLAMRWLETQGLGPASPLRVARPIFYDAAQCLLLQERAEGGEVANALHGDEATLRRHSQRAAEWLAQLHGGDGNGFKRSRASAVRSVHSRQRRLARAYPEMKPRLEPACEKIVARLRDSGRLPLVPTHGDYHPKNIFTGGDEVTVIDLDHFAQREAAADVGYFVGQMAIMARLRGGSFQAAAPAITAFLAEYRLRAAEEAPWERIATHVSRTFIQSLHYELCVLRNGRTELIDEWLGQAEAWLDSSSPGDIGSLIGEPMDARTERSAAGAGTQPVAPGRRAAQGR